MALPAAAPVLLALLVLLSSMRAAAGQPDSQQQQAAAAAASPAVTADCGQDNKPACSADPPLRPYPFCTEPGTVALFSTAGRDLIQGGGIRAVRGWCWRVGPDCGTAPGKPCCPQLFQQSSSPRLRTQGCNGNANNNEANPRGALYCQVDEGAAATQKYRAGDQAVAFLAGTCVANEQSCGNTGSSCCHLWSGGCCLQGRCFERGASCSAAVPGTCLKSAADANTLAGSAG